MTSFLVYPLPSIADESFLQLIFQGKVTRSLFAGFGKRRFALAQIGNDSEFAARVCEAIRAHNLQHEQQHYEKSDAQKHEQGKQHNQVANGSCTSTIESSDNNSGKEALLHTWLSEMHGEDNVTLAQLYNEPTLADILHEQDATQQKRGSGRKGKRTNSNGGVCEEDNVNIAQFVNEYHLQYINHLFWRGQPVHVILSHVQLDEFYNCGGVVPQHNLRQVKKNLKRESNIVNKQGKKSKVVYDKKQQQQQLQQQQVKQTTNNGNKIANAKEAEETHHNVQHTQNVLMRNKQANKVNNKNVSNHSHTDNNVINNIAGGKRLRAVQQHNNALTVNTNKTKSTGKFPKDCCQKCGSTDHFTRHCTASSDITSEDNKEKKDVKNLAESEQIKQIKAPKKQQFTKQQVTAPITTTEAIALQKQHKHENKSWTDATKPHAQTNTNNIKNVKVQNASFVRTSKDQCKYCGSEDHLSRHCPSKGQ